jgi:hypothetical protein
MCVLFFLGYDFFTSLEKASCFSKGKADGVRTFQEFRSECSGEVYGFLLGAVDKLCRLGRGEGVAPKVKDDLLHRPYLIKGGEGVKNCRF